MNDLWHYWLHIRADVVFALGRVAAVLVIVHVLLRKRKVASAVGWIGFAWFAPIMGSIAYFVFGINRVQRRTRELRPSSRSNPTQNAHRISANGYENHAHARFQHPSMTVTAQTLVATM